MTGPSTFVPFGACHLVALAAIALAAAGLAAAARTGRALGPRGRRVLAGLMVGAAASEILLALTLGWAGWRDVVPLQLCDLTLLLAAYTLVTLDRRTVAPTVFFALTGTVLALLTPELPGPVGTFRFLAYFGLHGLTVAAAVALTAGLGHWPRRGDWWRTLLVLNACAAVVAVVNLVLGANYLYLRAKPVTASPFDWMGPWPFYLLTLEVVCGALFYGLERLARYLTPVSTNRSDALRTKE